ncbi:MAG: hypothetical protein EHM21_00015 [Chloroflexi bacterium]|nr:MAG: hypothetical protein EHM21_00015 [Chloroflexota bacterium]
MNQQRPTKPAGRARSSVRGSGKSFTPQQIIVLILVGVLGSAALILAAFVLLSNRPALKSAAPVSETGPALPPTWTPQPANAAPAAGTPIPGQPLPALPASCALAGREFSQGTLIRVVDGNTVEVQVEGNTLRIGYAGIEVTPESGQVAQKANELLNGQPVILVKDISEQDSAGRLLRYVFAGGRFINFELVRQGLAVAQVNSPDQSCAVFLQQAQQQARAERLGLWNPTPAPTKTFVPFVTLDPSAQSECDCSKRYECSDFRTHDEAQTCLNACNDYSSKLDDDRDGIACENLP